MDLCRRAARLALGRERLQEIETLPLPQSLKNYLQYQWLSDTSGKLLALHDADYEQDREHDWNVRRTNRQKERLHIEHRALQNQAFGIKNGGWTDRRVQPFKYKMAPAFYEFPAALIHLFIGLE